MKVSSVSECRTNSLFLRFKRGVKGRPHIWFIHGFGASSDSFSEAFDLKYLRGYTLFAPDFPGFGLSKPTERPHDIKRSAKLLVDLISRFSRGREIVLVAHSLGGLVATEAALKLRERVKLYVNVEGNFTAADCFYSKKAANSRSPKKWKERFLNDLYKIGLRDPNVGRYWASFRLASPLALQKWGRSGVGLTGVDRGGRDFLRVSCPKYYVYGSKSVTAQTMKFIRKHGVEAIAFKGCGHFVMGDAPNSFYRGLVRLIRQIG